MTRKGVQPGTLTYNSLINACAKASNLARAEHWLSAMKGSSARPDDVTYCTVINACAQAGEPLRAEGWLETMRGEPHLQAPSAFCYNVVIQACARANDPDRAVKWFETGKRLAVEMSANSCHAIASALQRAGRCQEAVRYSSQTATAPAGASSGNGRRKDTGSSRPVATRRAPAAAWHAGGRW
jgi:pentatricopeptide repeat protein